MSDKENDALMINNPSSLVTPSGGHSHPRILTNPNFNENTMFTTEAKDELMSRNVED